MAVTKKELICSLADTIGFNKTESAALVGSFFTMIIQTLAEGEPVKLSGFGNFKLRNKNARVGRNPVTGEPSKIAARRVVTFKVSPKLQHCCNPQLLNEDA